MVDIHVVTDANKHLYVDQLEQSYRIRYQIYIEELKWRSLTKRSDRREIDQFDTPAAVHLLAVESDRVLGGTRLIHTSEPHLLSDVFPWLVGYRDVPVADDIVEWTRFYVVREVRYQAVGSNIAAAILSSCIDYALDEGMSALSTVLDVRWLPRFLRYKWKMEPLGLPHLYDDEWLVATLIHIDDAALSHIRAFNQLDERSLLVRRGPQRPLFLGTKHQKVA